MKRTLSGAAGRAPRCRRCRRAARAWPVPPARRAAAEPVTPGRPAVVLDMPDQALPPGGLPRAGRGGRPRAAAAHRVRAVESERWRDAGARAACVQPADRALPAAGRSASCGGRWTGGRARRTAGRSGRFQRAHRIAPATGFAGPVTGATDAADVGPRRTPTAPGSARSGRERTAVRRSEPAADLGAAGRTGDLRAGGDPVGRADDRTRTGSYRDLLEAQEPHRRSSTAPRMPYAQFFDGGQALPRRLRGHLLRPARLARLRQPAPSTDARKLWDVLTKGDTVYVWGRKPGV